MADYSKEQLMGALKKADAAGDTEAAQAIARKLNSLRPAEEQVTTAPQEGIEEKKDVDISMADAALRGFGQGFTLEQLDEGIASYETGKQVVGEIAQGLMDQGVSGNTDAAPSMAETYRKNKEDQQEYLNRVKDKYPLVYQGSNIAGVIANAAATMGAGHLLHGAKFMSSATNVAGIMGGAGFIHGVGSSESDNLGDWIREGKEGAAGAIVGELAAPGSAQALKYLKQKRAEGFLKFLDVPEHVANKSLEVFGKDVSSWIDRCLDYTDEVGEKIFSPIKRRANLLDDVQIQERIAGDKMGAVLNRIDSEYKLDINPQLIYTDIKNYAIDPLLEKTINADQIKEIQRADKFLRDSLFEFPVMDTKTNIPSQIKPSSKLTLANLHNFKVGIYANGHVIKRATDPKVVNKHLVQEAIADRIGQNIKQIVSTSSELVDPQMIEEYTGAVQRFGDLREAGKLLQGSLHKDKGAKILNESFTSAMLKTAALYEMANKPGVGLRKTFMAAMGLKAIKEHPNVNAVIGKSAEIVGKAIEADPNKYELIARSLSAASAISGEALMEELMTSSAKVDLMSNPLARSTEEVIKRKDSILTMLEAKDPNLASQLGAAIQKRDTATIQQIMSANGTGSMIQPGIGWDGIAVSDQDKQAVSNWLQSIGSSKKRMLMTSKFNKDFMIPQEYYAPVQLEPMQQFVHRKRLNKISKPEL